MAWLQDARATGAVNRVTNAVIVHCAERERTRSLGVLADASLDAYMAGRIKLHEKTIAKTEQKMVDYMASTRLYGNPVVLAHGDDQRITETLSGITRRAPDADFTAIDETRHRLWVVTGDDALLLAQQFEADLYIADGHHRLAAAAALAKAEGRQGDFLPAGVYSESEFTIAAFARGVRSSSLKTGWVIDQLSAEFRLDEIDVRVPRPSAPHTFGVRIAGRSFLLTVPVKRIVGDAYDRLDVNVLQQLILEPILGIDDPRHDRRLEVMADLGDGTIDPDRYDAWFLPYPTSVGEVVEVADMGRTMPPKSTFFRPKIPGGMLIRAIDEPADVGDGAS